MLARLLFQIDLRGIKGKQQSADQDRQNAACAQNQRQSRLWQYGSTLIGLFIKSLSADRRTIEKNSPG